MDLDPDFVFRQMRRIQTVRKEALRFSSMKDGDWQKVGQMYQYLLKKDSIMKRSPQRHPSRTAYE